MKAKIVLEVIACDVLPVAMFFTFLRNVQPMVKTPKYTTLKTILCHSKSYLYPKGPQSILDNCEEGPC